jgi:hypothetical protein
VGRLLWLWADKTPKRIAQNVIVTTTSPTNIHDFEIEGIIFINPPRRNYGCRTKALQYGLLFEKYRYYCSSLPVPERIISSSSWQFLPISLT